MKWSSPFFLHQGILAGMPAFKRHCAIIFWKGKLILGKERAQLRRLTSADDLPADKILLGWLRKAVELNETGTNSRGRSKGRKKDAAVPDYFLAALKRNKKALTTFEKMSNSHRREYIEWISGAKRDETRMRRIRTAIEWLAQGKSLNWKYREKRWSL